MKKEEGLEGKKKKSKKLTIIISILGPIIVLAIVAFVLYTFGCFEKEVWDEFINEFSSVTTSVRVMAGVVIGVLALLFWFSHKHKSKWQVKFVEKSLWGFLGGVFLPYVFLLFMLLGSLHGMYGYESTMATDLNVSMGAMGGAFNSIYEIGDSNPTKGLIIFFVIIGGAVLLWISDVIGYYKEHLKKEPKPKHL